MKLKFASLGLLFVALMIAVPLMAHHSITAEFDTSKSFTVKGTITKIEWVNPHAYVYVDAKDDKGAMTHYSFETGPPGNLRRSGVLRTMFAVGDAMTIDAYAAKDGSKNLGLVKAYHFADGKTIVVGKDPAEVEAANK
jgi:hypothetical protein